MSKHLIGIDAELYILYEEKVLFKTSENNVGNAFVSPLPLFLLMTERRNVSSIKVLILFNEQNLKTKQKTNQLVFAF